MSNDEHKLFGRFKLTDDRQVMGEVSVAGTESYVYLNDDKKFELPLTDGSCIAGVLHNLNKITLIDCIPQEGPSLGTRDGIVSCSWRLFPHFIVVGQRHLDPKTSAIQSITLFLEDAPALFYDFDAFGSSTNVKSHIDGIVKSNVLDRDIPIGEQPIVAYFTGRREIFKVDTLLGTVAAYHNPSYGSGGPSGVCINNEISITVTPHTSLTLPKTISNISDLLRLFDILIGRPQSIKHFWLQDGDKDDQTGQLHVYWSHGPERTPRANDERFRPSPTDVLVDPIRHPEEFSAVVTG